MAADPQPPAGPTADQRIDKLEQTQAEHGTKLDAILGALKGLKPGDPAPAPAPPAGGQTSIADEIARQLDDRDAKDKAAASSKAHDEWKAGVDAKLSGMAEQVPDPPVRKIETRMGWR